MKKRKMKKLRLGDIVKVIRGDHASKSGFVTKIMRLPTKNERNCKYVNTSPFTEERYHDAIRVNLGNVELITSKDNLEMINDK